MDTQKGADACGVNSPHRRITTFVPFTKVITDIRTIANVSAVSHVPLPRCNSSPDIPLPFPLRPFVFPWPAEEGSAVRLAGFSDLGPDRPFVFFRLTKALGPSLRRRGIFRLRPPLLARLLLLLLHSICTKSSNALRLPRNQLESAAPVTKDFATATCKTLKMLRLPRNQNFTHCARMISTNFFKTSSCENEPIVRQGQRKRHSRTRWRAFQAKHLKTTTPQREPPWICNANVSLDKTLRLRTTSAMLRATIPTPGREK